MTKWGSRLLVAAGIIGYLAAIRPWMRCWGASRDECRAALPGDELAPAQYQTTHGITIVATPDEVWPWLVQMGYGRGGWYSYDLLERFVGAGDFLDGGSARRIVPELQTIALDDIVSLSARGGLTVARLDPPRALVLHFRMNVISGAPAREGDPAVLDWTWAFILEPQGAATCRLLVRTRAGFRPRFLAMFGLLLDPIHFVMERKMLLTIRQRAGDQR
jgi:hypothetical protein